MKSKYSVSCERVYIYARDLLQYNTLKFLPFEPALPLLGHNLEYICIT